MDEVLHLEIRKKIYKLLLKNPGVNLSTIAKQIEISVALADYHLHHMEGNGLLTIVKEGGYKRYYVKGEIGAEDKKLLSLVQQEIPLKIVLYLLNNPNSKPGQLREKIEISPALLTYYLKKLVRYKLISGSASGERKAYKILDEQRVLRLLIRYRPNILLQRFKETWMDEFPFGKKASFKKK